MVQDWQCGVAEVRDRQCRLRVAKQRIHRSTRAHVFNAWRRVTAHTAAARTAAHTLALRTSSRSLSAVLWAWAAAARERAASRVAVRQLQRRAQRRVCVLVWLAWREEVACARDRSACALGSCEKLRASALRDALHHWRGHLAWCKAVRCVPPLSCSCRHARRRQSTDTE